MDRFTRATKIDDSTGADLGGWAFKTGIGGSLLAVGNAHYKKLRLRCVAVNKLNAPG